MAATGMFWRAMSAIFITVQEADLHFQIVKMQKCPNKTMLAS